MSFKVLVIPEDPTNNGYILKPLVEAMMKDAGRPNAQVSVLTNPRLEGYDHALRAIKEDLPDRYGFWHLWLFFPDADSATPMAMKNLEQELAGKNIRLICCIAKPESEIYACAGCHKELGLPWNQVRNHPKLKEEIFQPLLKNRGDARRAGAGRDILIIESLKNLSLLYQLCPELRELTDRIKALQ